MSKVYTTTDISRLCHVTPKTVVNWIDSGKLSCMKTAGGFRKVFHQDLINFMKENNIPFGELEDRRKKILVIDDNPDDINLLLDLLKSDVNNFIVEKAYSGDEGLYKIGVFKPDLLILDIFLPQMDGFRVAEMVRKTPEINTVKIIFISGLDQIDLSEKITQYGTKYFLSKPLDKKKLTATLREIFQ